MRHLLAAAMVMVLVAAFSPATAGAQTPTLPPRDGARPAAPGTAGIRGRVVQLDTGQPLRRVQITARRSGGGDAQSVMTDNDGRFALTALPAGSYVLAAARGGYVTIEHGQRRPLEPGRPVVIADAQTLENVNFSLPRGSVITGRVVDELGEAVTGAMVQVHRYRYANGQRQLAVAGGGAPTDDRGQFRVFGLLPGDYYVSAAPPGDTFAALAALASGGGAGGFAMPGPGTQAGYIRTYYPDTPWPASAQRITLRVGEESPLLTLQLVAGRTVSIAGTVVGPDGPAATASIIVRPKGSDPSSALLSGNMTAAIKGIFKVSGLVPGDYTVDAMVIDITAMPPKMSFGTTDISVGNADISDVAITAGSGVTARGRIVFEGGKPEGINLNQVQLTTTSPIPSLAPSRADVKDDGSFEIQGLFGRRTIRAMLPQPWFLKSITHRGIDVTDQEVNFSADMTDVTITFTRTATDVSGRVADARGTATSDFVVLLYADDRARWTAGTRFVRTARPDQDGRYQIRGLPPGRYLAVALQYLEPGEEFDPERLELFTRSATRLELREGDTRTLDLRLSDF